MGFIGKIFGAIFGLIGAIFGAIGKVFGIGGKSNYYVELNDAQRESAASAAPAPKTADAAPMAASATAAPKATAPAKKQVAEPAATSSPAPTPMPAVYTPPKQNGKAAVNVVFAADNVLTLSSTGSRRRPGPSLSPFKVMARQVQRPGKA